MLANREGDSLSGLSWIESFIPALRTGLWGISPSGLLGEFGVNNSTKYEGEFLDLRQVDTPLMLKSILHKKLRKIDTPEKS